MTINCYQISDGPSITPCDYNTAAEGVGRSDTNAWIDIQDCESAELEGWLDKLEIKGLARRLCLQARDRPGFYPLNTMIFVVVPVEVTDGNAGEIDYVSFLCGNKLMLSMRSARTSYAHRITTVGESAEWFPNSTIGGLVSAIMIVLSLESMHHLTELRGAITALEERVDLEPGSVKASEISDVRSRFLVLEAVVSGQLPALQALTATDRLSFSLDSTREYLVVALTNLQATSRSLDWLEKRIDVIRSLFDMHSQSQTNHRLGRLTILSVIFMPITLLAGIWGMNFEEMPELGIPFGYPMALGSMVLIGVAMYYYFRRKGWFE